MSSITFDSELLRQPVAEKPLEDVQDFRVVLDAKEQPVVFVLSRKGKLLMLAADKNGNMQLVDLSSKLELPATDRVCSMAVSQGANIGANPAIYLVLATTNGKNESSLFVLGALSPTTDNWYAKINKQALYSGTQRSSMSITNLLLVSHISPTYTSA